METIWSSARLINLYANCVVADSGTCDLSKSLSLPLLLEKQRPEQILTERLDIVPKKYIR